jgi:protein-S-isoprenylcysteine O-methyltransferase Ste14
MYLFAICVQTIEAGIKETNVVFKMHPLKMRSRGGIALQEQFVLFGAALIGFVAATLALLGWLVPHDWWRTLAIVFAVVSMVTVVLYWNAFVAFFPNKVGALGVDIAILVCLLWLNWPSEVDIGY